MDLGNWDDDEDELTNGDLRQPPPADDDLNDLFHFETVSVLPVDDVKPRVDTRTALPSGVHDLSGDRGVLIEYHPHQSSPSPSPSPSSSSSSPTSAEQPQRLIACAELPYVELHYDGFIVGSGDKFDSTRDQNYPMVAHLDLPPKGKSSLIPGLELALQHVHPGQRATITVLSHYAYGAKGSQDIPPDADLRFDVLVLDVRATHRKMEVVDTSKKDLSRLEDVRRQREIAQLRREEEDRARQAEKDRKAQRAAALREKLANKNKQGKKGGGKKKK